MTAILDWGFVGKQVRPSIIALLASVSLVLFAAVGIVSALPDGVTTSGEELIEPEWLPPPADAQDVSKFGNDACGAEACYVLFSSYDFEPELEELALEHQMLVNSLSPAARAIYLGGIQDRADAREKERERAAAERERDEAEYAVFIREHLRRLNEERPSRK